MQKIRDCFARYSLLLVVFLLSGCSSLQTTQTNTSLDTAIENARVVHVGETHTNYGHHVNQLAIIKKAHKMWGGVISIGLEMVQQPFQTHLDDYIAGKFTEREMLKRVEWYSRWRYDFRLYRPLFDYAKRNNIPLIALNVPQALTRKISRKGIASLSPSERSYLPPTIDKSDAKYTARLKQIFEQHSHGNVFNQRGFDKFVEAQLAWDEGMAYAASKYLKQTPKQRMVILAGSGHLLHRAGIPNRLDRQLKLSGKHRSVVILSHDEKPYDKTQADFSLKANNSKLAPLGLLGIRMKDTAQGVQIVSVIEASAAKQAGILSGDILLQLNKTKIKTSSEVSLWRLDKAPKESVEVLIKRGNQQRLKRLVLGG